MYLYNKFLMNILNDINIVSCPLKRNSNTIELTVHTSTLLVIGVINLLCVTILIFNSYFSCDFLESDANFELHLV